MKALFTFIIIVAATFASLAQNVNLNQNATSNYSYLDSLPQSSLQLFAHTPGLILNKENVNIGNVGNIYFERVRVTDVLNKQAQTSLLLHISSTTQACTPAAKPTWIVTRYPAF